MAILFDGSRADTLDVDQFINRAKFAKHFSIGNDFPCLHESNTVQRCRYGNGVRHIDVELNHLFAGVFDCLSSQRRQGSYC